MSPKPVTRYLVQLHEYAHESGIGRGLAVHEPKKQVSLILENFLESILSVSQPCVSVVQSLRVPVPR